MTITEIAARFQVSKAEVVTRAALTPAMMARIAAWREDAEFSRGWFGAADESDDEIALGFVCGDLAAERD